MTTDVALPLDRRAEIVTEILGPMVTFYDRPKHVKSEAQTTQALELWADELLARAPDFSIEQLRETAALMDDEIDVLYWPRPGRILKLLRRVCKNTHGATTRDQNMKKRAEYVFPRIPVLVDVWKLGRPHEWARARDEGWGRELCKALETEAFLVAHTEYHDDQENLHSLVVDFEAIEGDVKARIVSRRRSYIEACRTRYGVGRALPLPERAAEALAELERAQDTWLPHDARHGAPEAEPAALEDDFTDDLGDFA